MQNIIYTKTDKILFANDFFDHIWFSLGNKYISVPSGFSTSLKDHQIENLIFYMFKTFKIDKKNFDEKINNRECIRECFAAYFNYKYVVNSIRHYKPLNEEYSKVDVKNIQNISEIDWWYLIIPNSEKTRLKDKFINLEFDQSYSPNLIILTNHEKLFFGENLSDNYTKVIDGRFYRVYKKN